MLLLDYFFASVEDGINNIISAAGSVSIMLFLLGGVGLDPQQERDLMDQIIFVVLGTVITVAYYILSPVKFSERVLGLLERLGKINTAGIAGKAQKARSYHVRFRK